jgi:hypothetical protein
LMGVFVNTKIQKSISKQNSNTNYHKIFKFRYSISKYRCFT